MGNKKQPCLTQKTLDSPNSEIGLLVLLTTSQPSRSTFWKVNPRPFLEHRANVTTCFNEMLKRVLLKTQPLSKALPLAHILCTQTIRCRALLKPKTTSVASLRRSPKVIQFSSQTFFATTLRVSLLMPNYRQDPGLIFLLK